MRLALLKYYVVVIRNHMTFLGHTHADIFVYTIAQKPACFHVFNPFSPPLGWPGGEATVPL